MNRLFGLATANRFAATRVSARFSALRSYASHDSPHNDYNAFVSKWVSFFKNVDEDCELERGLNLVFTYDWVPSIEVVEEGIKASRRLNSFPTAVRILEAIEEKVEKKAQYEQYLRELKPLLEEYGIVEKNELGAFNYVRDKLFWRDSQ